MEVLRVACPGCGKICRKQERYCYACGSPLAVLQTSSLSEVSLQPHLSTDFQLYIANEGGGQLEVEAKAIGSDGQRVPWATVLEPKHVLAEGADGRQGGAIGVRVDADAFALAEVRHCKLVLSSNTEHGARTFIDSVRGLPIRWWDRWSRRDLALSVSIRLESPPEFRSNVDQLELDLWRAEEELLDHLRISNQGGGTIEVEVSTHSPHVTFYLNRFVLNAGTWSSVPFVLSTRGLIVDTPLEISLDFHEVPGGRCVGTIRLIATRRTTRELGVVFGVDFGTSTSKVATLLDEDIQVVQFSGGEGQPPMDTYPSVLYVANNIVRAIGVAAEQYIGNDGYVSGIKRLLAFSEHSDPAEKERLQRLGGVERLVSAFLERLMAEVLANADIRERYGDALVPENITLVATVPARARGEREERMRKILTDLGYRHVRILVESTAAAYLYARSEEYLPDGSLLMVFDCGAGTTDVTLMRVSLQRNEEDGSFERRFEPLAEVGVERGGRDLDDAFYDLAVSRLSTAEREVVAQWERDEGGRRSTKVLDILERAKISLCGTDGERGSNEEELFIPGLAERVVVTRADLGSAVRTIVDEIAEGVWLALAQAGENLATVVDPPRIEKVYLVGGSTFVPWIRARLVETFTSRKVVGLPDRVTAVTRGAVASLFRIKRVVPVRYGYRTGAGAPVWFVFRGTVCPLSERLLRMPLLNGADAFQILAERDGLEPEVIGQFDLRDLGDTRTCSLSYRVDDHGMLHCSLVSSTGLPALEMVRKG